MKTRQISEFKETEIGKIPLDWGIKSIKEISEKLVVGFVGTCAPYYCEKDKGFPMIRTTNLTNDGLDFSDLKYITKEFHEKNKKSQLQYGDILIARHGENGLPCYYDQTFEAQALNVIIFHSNPEICNTKFLFFMMKSPQIKHQIKANSTGTVQDVLNTKSLAELEIPLPALDEQNMIVKILESLEQKINTLKQQNKILEQIAQTIFKSWFVDFDGVTEFEDSELGQIPKGWSVGNLGDICEIVMGSSPPGESYNEERNGVIFFQGKTDFGDFFPNPRKYCSMPKRFAEKDDVLFTVRAPIGSINIAKEKYCIGRGLAALRLKENSGCFLYFFLKSLETQWDSYESAGTVFGSINKDELNDLKVIISPTKILTKFNISMKPVYNQIWDNNANLHVLSKIYDTLLPKLMSGEIRV